MKKKKLIKWGVLGYGNAAQQFLDKFKNSNISKIYAIASISKKRLRPEDEKKTIKFYDSYLDLIKDKKLDIIYIALPNNFHNYWATMSIKYNKNILIEKPAMVSAKDIRSILKLAKKKRKFVFESIYFRSHPNIEKLIKLLKIFNLKKILSIHASFGNDALGGKKFFGIRLKKPKKNKRLFNPNMYGGSIWDTGCYPITFVNIFTILFFNKVLKKKNIIYSKRKIGFTKVDMSSEIIFKLKNTKIFLKTSIEENLDNNIKINFEGGSLKIDNLLNIGKKINVMLFKNNIKKKIHVIKSKENIFKNFIKKINLTIIENKNKFHFPSITNKETNENIKILEKWRN